MLALLTVGCSRCRRRAGRSPWFAPSATPLATGAGEPVHAGPGESARLDAPLRRCLRTRSAQSPARELRPADVSLRRVALGWLHAGAAFADHSCATDSAVEGSPVPFDRAVAARYSNPWLGSSLSPKQRGPAVVNTECVSIPAALVITRRRDHHDLGRRGVSPCRLPTARART